MQELNSCGCCDGISIETPIEISNRPGLSAISYRVGNHPQFKESMLAGLSISKLRALKELTTRSDDDFSIALLDAWAVVADVLTFYQERIANESYLGTAVEQLSVLELARLIGYKLRPGVAASTYVAFNLEENSLAESQAFVAGIARGKEEKVLTTIVPGTKMQTIPGPDEEPQNFETTETIEATPEWNAMKPQLSQRQDPSTDELLIINGAANNVKAGDVIFITQGVQLKRVQKVEFDNDNNTTWLYLQVDASLAEFNPPATYVSTGSPDDFPANSELTKRIVVEIINKTWTEANLAILVEAQGWSLIDLEENIKSQYEKVALQNDQVYIFRRRAAFFGYNAPPKIDYTSGTPVSGEWPLETGDDSDNFYLDSTYEEILEGSFVSIKDDTAAERVHIVNTVDHIARTAYGMSAKCTRLATTRLIDDANPEADGTNDLSILRSSSLNVQSEALPLTNSPIEEVVSGDTIRLSKLYLGLKKGRNVIISGEREDLPGTYADELGTLKEIYIYKGRTILILEKTLTYAYVRKNVSINANVALATHGESVSEILGDGDATKVFQTFKLKQTPLTFVSASTASGTASTLEILINNIAWTEVSSLYDRGPTERIFTSHQNDLSETIVTFGDGKTGARLPSGQANVAATYRKGIGNGGLIKAHQLSQLVSRPLGVKSVSNPIASSGAQDAESLEEARSNATLTIFTLGRIVSLKDYEDFCRAFAGISKALVHWAWCSQKRCVHITVAGSEGATITRDSELYQNLLDAIAQAGIPGVVVIVDSYLPAFFRIEAKIKIMEDYQSDIVLQDIELALREAFSFDNRNFGQAVSYSEVISVMQNVEGVLAIDMDQFYRSDQSPGLESQLLAAAPRPGSLELVPAELLTLDPSPVELNIMI